ncbi:MAG: hypothetical protein AMXMBFR55_14670 [Gemmatimonadota bacterium]
MARALAELWSTVPEAARAEFLARARAREGALKAIGVYYWVFERSDAPGEVVQYIEAKDPALLEQARAIIGTREGERELLLHQLEL